MPFSIKRFVLRCVEHASDWADRSFKNNVDAQPSVFRAIDVISDIVFWLCLLADAWTKVKTQVNRKIGLSYAIK